MAIHEASGRKLTYAALVTLFMSQYDSRSQDWKHEMLGYSVTKFGDVQVRNLLPDRVSAWLRGLQLAPKTEAHPRLDAAGA
jgi:hypothetical protein